MADCIALPNELAGCTAGLCLPIAPLLSDDEDQSLEESLSKGRKICSGEKRVAAAPLSCTSSSDSEEDNSQVCNEPKNNETNLITIQIASFSPVAAESVKGIQIKSETNNALAVENSTSTPVSEWYSYREPSRCSTGTPDGSDLTVSCDSAYNSVSDSFSDAMSPTGSIDPFEPDERKDCVINKAILRTDRPAPIAEIVPKPLETEGAPSHMGFTRRRYAKKRQVLVSDCVGLRKPEPPPRQRISKQGNEPLPMRYRKFPKSFFEPPNKPSTLPPAAAPVDSTLPRLFGREFGEDLREIRPVTPPEQRQDVRGPVKEYRITCHLQGDDMLKKLFEGVDPQAQKLRPTRATRTNASEVKTPVSRALCTRPLINRPNASGTSTNDPFLFESVTDKLLPQLTIETTPTAPPRRLDSMPRSETHRISALPQLGNEQSHYTQLLSDLVKKI